MAVQTFNPDHVLVSEKLDGTLLPEMTEYIMTEVANNSAVMQLGQYVEMNGKQSKTFNIQTDGVSAYWVDEGHKIQTSKPELIQVEMRAKKLGVILLASREALTYTWSEFFDDMKGQIASAFHKKFDSAAILNVDNPFAFSIDQAAIASENVTTGDVNYDNVLSLEDFIADGGGTVDAFISTTRNHTALRKAVDPDTKLSIYDRHSGVIDGRDTVVLEEVPKGTIYAVDHQNIRYGVPYNINYAISTEGTISTVTNPDGSPINLFEQELVALRATMDVAFMTLKDEGFAKLQAEEAGEDDVPGV